MLIKSLFVLLFSILPCLASKEAQPQPPQPFRIVATFSILQDLIQTLCKGCPGIQVDTLVPLNADPHTYQPTPQDVIKLTHAQLVVVNGANFEEWMDKMIHASDTKGDIVVASTGAALRVGVNDPHLWHDPANLLIYITNVEKALCKHLPAMAATIRANARHLRAEAMHMHHTLKKMFDSLPSAQRTVITTHDAFWYFGRAFGITFEAPIGISTEAEPTAADVKRLIDHIKAHKLKAVFIENLSLPRVVEQIAAEAHIPIRGTLYADSLSKPSGPAPTTLAMIEHNARLIYEALKDEKP